jgi:hypothetical protein
MNKVPGSNGSKKTFANHIVTDNMSIDEVVEEIAELCGLDLVDDNRSTLKKKLDRIVVQMNHIRLPKVFG